MTPENLRRLRWTIHGGAIAAAGLGAGLASVPFVDTVALMHLQATMVAAIARLHGADPTYTEAMQLVLGVGGSATDRVLRFGLLRVFPTRMPWVRAATAAATTEAIGWAAHAAFTKRTAQDPLSDVILGIGTK